ncbi:MAG: tRNA (adenosine(37)-N6)-threonylcarbamoyltransferase complex dimerization subunit type 1 TsaB [Lachnospiraceae bacterium]|nr:tRNA (adenosine(37)-N6)-threonylcarbamoyltransferase complex dimerization subunit type 1 TsaB [Lachnospiraceae bacterium]
MKILGFDSSGMVASVAVMQDDIIVAEYSVNYKKTHSQTLLPMLDEVVKMTELDLDEVDAIAVAAGPGSFTGLRIGMATVKGFGLALDKPVIAVPTCHALAYNLWGSDRIICPILDARRNQVYTALYEFADNELMCIKEQEAMDICDIIEHINDIGKEVIFLGDGVPVFKSVIEDKMRAKALFAPAHLSRQRASAVAALGRIYYERGEYESADDVKPIYLRKSQAEREREEKDGSRQSD